MSVPGPLGATTTAVKDTDKRGKVAVRIRCTHTGMELLKHTHIGVRHFCHLGLKRDPFPDILGPHIGGKVRWSRPPGHTGPLDPEHQLGDMDNFLL